MTQKKMCQSVPKSEARTAKVQLWFTPGEKEEVRAQAAARHLTVSDYARRCIFSRRADLRMEVDIIIAIRDLTAEIKAIHASYVALGEPPPEDALRPVLTRAITAMLRLEHF